MKVPYQTLEANKNNTWTVNFSIANKIPRNYNSQTIRYISLCAYTYIHYASHYIVTSVITTFSLPHALQCTKTSITCINQSFVQIFYFLNNQCHFKCERLNKYACTSMYIRIHMNEHMYFPMYDRGTYGRLDFSKWSYGTYKPILCEYNFIIYSKKWIFWMYICISHRLGYIFVVSVCRMRFVVSS